MRNIKILLIIASYSLLSGCKQNGNGNYLIYKTRDGFDALFMANEPRIWNEQDQDALKAMYARLESGFLGKTVNFNFQKDYIEMNFNNSNNYKDIILNSKPNRHNIEYYYGERIVGQTSVQFSLMRNDTKFLILAIDVSIPKGERIFIPAQSGAQLKGNTSADLPDRKVRVIFCLKKVE